jgi:alpha-tubulin suppressor-like RCC1 family protein
MTKHCFLIFVNFILVKITLHAQIAPSIISSSISQIVAVGQNVNLSVTANGSAPLAYQWYKNGVKIVGATSSILSIKNASINDLGYYSVKVSNYSGAIWSASREGKIIMSASVSDTFSMYIGNDDKLYGFGDNSQYQLTGQVDREQTSPVVIDTNVSYIAAGDRHSLWVKNDGTLWSVGRGTSGQLGTGGLAYQQETPYKVADNVSYVAACGNHSLFIKNDGTLWGMGDNTSGELGITPSNTVYAPVLIATNVAKVATGDSYTIFIKTDGTLWGLGDNTNGQLGIGNNINSQNPVIISSNVADCACGSASTFYLKIDGSLWGVGDNSYGQLGVGDQIARNTPVQIVTSGVLSLDAKDFKCGFIKDDGNLWVVGDNSSGELSDGTTNSCSLPEIIASNVTGLSFGGTCLIYETADGKLLGSGTARTGQLGVFLAEYQCEPLQVATNISNQRISCGQDFNLYIDGSNNLWGTGSNNFNQLLGQVPISPAPNTANWLNLSTLLGVGSVNSVSAGGAHTAFLTADGNLWVMGSSHHVNDHLSIRDKNVIKCSSGTDFGCYIKADSTLWTYTQGGLAPGIPLGQIDSGVIDVSANANAVTYLKSDGSLWVIGYTWSTQIAANHAIQIDSGVSKLVQEPTADAIFYIKKDQTLWSIDFFPYNASSMNDITPHQIDTNVVNASAGIQSIIYSKKDTTLWVQGQNTDGELGPAKDIYVMSPTQISNSGFIYEASASDHSILLKSDNSLWLIGHSPLNSFGLGIYPQSLITNYGLDIPRTLTALEIVTNLPSESKLSVELAQSVVTITSPTSFTLGQSYTATANGGNGTGSYVYSLGLGSTAQGASINSSTGAVTATSPGTVIITAYKASDSTYAQSLPSNNFTITVLDIPISIQTNPSNQSIINGSPVSFSVSVTGTNASYQWYQNNIAISGATSSTYLISSASSASAGSYTVVISNSAGSVTSQAAQLIVTTPITITKQPTAQTVNEGSSATLSIVATGSSPVYQWYLNNAAINGATSSTYTISFVTLANAGSYTCSVSNLAGTVSSTTALLSVITPPLISSQPISNNVKPGGSVTLSVVASGTNPNYQWYLNGVAIAGATLSTYTIPTALPGNAGSYTVTVTNSAGTVTSQVAQVTVSNPGRLMNLSVLSLDGPGSQLLTLGFVSGGMGTTGSENLLIRGSGPAIGLSPFNVQNVLSDPILTVFNNASLVVAYNDNWGTPASNAAAVIAADAATGAFALTSNSSLDAALVTSLTPGAYTVQVAGKNNTTGNVIAEVYDNTSNNSYTMSTPRLVNLSCLQQISAGGILTAGFVIGGSSAEQVLIRASGPTLSAAPFNLTGTIPDPKLTVFNSTSSVIASNTGWSGNSAITAANSATGAFQFVNNASKDSAVLLTLQPGAYTVQATSASGAAGVTLIEVYEVQNN